MGKFQLTIESTSTYQVIDLDGYRANVGIILSNREGRVLYDRAIVERRDGHYYARLTGPQGSGILTSMSQANGLVIIPEGQTVNKGDSVRALMLDWNQEVNI